MEADSISKFKQRSEDFFCNGSLNKHSKGGVRDKLFNIPNHTSVNPGGAGRG